MNNTLNWRSVYANSKTVSIFMTEDSIQLINDMQLFQLVQRRKNDPLIKDLCFIQMINQNSNVN